MNWMLAAVTFAALFGSNNPASAVTYVCDVLADYRVKVGFLERQGDLWVTASPRFVFDEETGVLTQDGLRPSQMEVLQRGSPVNSLIAIRQIQGPANYVLTTLRITTFEEQVSFLLDDGYNLFSGSCSMIGVSK